MDGSSSLGREDWNDGMESGLKWSRSGGSSIEERIRSRFMSTSECIS